MALITCSECKSEISDTASKCPKCGFQLRKPQRSIIGQIFKLFFILFNILMILWLFSYFKEIGKLTQSQSKEAITGTTIGATIGTGLIGTVWFMGDVILGIFVLLTRPKN
jgi:DNA-directed RNA polymerase subunit RPC12/RpoP